MTDLTLMTFASDPATVLPSLALLSHRVRVLPMDAASLVKMPENTILFLDARDDLATAKTLCRLIHASGLSTPIVLVLTEGERGVETWIHERDGRIVDHVEFRDGRISKVKNSN